VIGSGPTVPDVSTLADARKILTVRDLRPPPSIVAALNESSNESPKPGDPIFARSEFRIVARPAQSLAAAEKVARTAGYETIMIGADLEGEAREVAGEHARLAIQLADAGRRAAILSGGELTVTLKGKGRGGPNQEYALALAIALAGRQGISAIAGDSDGTDGGGGKADDPAGAFIDQTTLQRAGAVGLDPARFLADNDSTAFFERIGDLLCPGPTCTNVNDLRVVLVDT
jgi:hydroxypyruvate reductase